MKPEPRPFEWCVSDQLDQRENLQWQYLSRLSDIAAPNVRAGKKSTAKPLMPSPDIAAPNMRAGKNIFHLMAIQSFDIAAPTLRAGKKVNPAQ